MDTLDRITLQEAFDRISTNGQRGQATIRGSRLSVAKIVNLVNTGYSIDEVVARYSHRIEREDVTQALRYASRWVRD